MAGNSIGMSVPGASSLMPDDPTLGSQVAGETEKQRKKRLAALQANKMLPSTGASALGAFTADYGAALGGR